MRQPPPSTVPAPPPDVAGATAAEPACENCGTALLGRYCHACGQPAEPAATTVRGFVRQAAEDVTNLDSRILRTLGLLLARPGRLTREYLDGRRIRYTKPLQLYLGAAAAFFFVNAYRPFLSFDPRTGWVRSTLIAAGANAQLGEEGRAALTARGVPMEVFRERFESAVTGYLPTLLAGLVLLFGLMLYLFFPRRRGYVEHAVFALHWSAFYLLLMIVDRLIPQGGAAPNVLEVGVLLAGGVYLALAIRHVYQPSWPATVLKTLGLLVIYQGLMSLWMISAIGFAFRMLL
ncbi:MAG TPA: DUF3667 domain-containing protein [Longimicrobium sp.]|nr:DUF3667 domain-containing protein [Longimicrobium sp.]